MHGVFTIVEWFLSTRKCTRLVYHYLLQGENDKVSPYREIWLRIVAVVDDLVLEIPEETASLQR